jgi:putative salt-induced outer membrane protein YdiY
VLLFFAAGAAADEVHLQNGNRLSGTIVGLSEGKLALETDFAGRISIDWGRVERIQTEAPIEVVLVDGTREKGTAAPGAASGRMELRLTPTTAAPLDLARVAAINPPAEPEVRFNGRINVGLNKAGGNTDTQAAHADAELIARSINHRVSTGAAYNRASKDNRKTEENMVGRLKHDYFLTPKLYWYTSGLAEKDEFKEIRLRATIGPGLGYQLFEGESLNLAVEAGPSYVTTRFDSGGSEDSASGRWAVRFDRFFFAKLFQYYFTNEGFVSASDASDVFMFTRTGLRFPIREGFSLNAGFEWDWDNQPAEDTDKSDYRYILALGYGF